MAVISVTSQAVRKHLRPDLGLCGHRGLKLVTFASCQLLPAAVSADLPFQRPLHSETGLAILALIYLEPLIAQR